ncbi:glycerophosphodiester phosphodiesterase [Mesorhizobium sp. Z1-4]|uniref:glycerophosphodiester phosphodiesterase n=1 Tax=Mesorhizobium sp. Z1-4 TaxID=2448478 RepID=UPI000FD959EB|nr:glycerophosphodiester phosphodiesterase [Mesorhizobium sp. Z1-4]
MSDLSWLTARPIAHRGLHDLNVSRWENTLSAFEAAVAGNFAIECDVHLAADGAPVVFHDGQLKRLTGEEGNTCDLTSVQLAELFVGGTQDRVPTLRQMLECVAGRVPIVIELKGIAGQDEGLVAEVGKLLSAYRGKAAIMSFDHWLVRRFAADAPGVPGGLTAVGNTQDRLEQHFSMLAHNPAFASFYAMELPNPFTEFMRHDLARPVITWTVRDRRAYDLTAAHADQMTFEGFNPDHPGDVAALR